MALEPDQNQIQLPILIIKASVSRFSRSVKALVFSRKVKIVTNIYQSKVLDAVFRSFQINSDIDKTD